MRGMAKGMMSRRRSSPSKQVALKYSQPEPPISVEALLTHQRNKARLSDLRSTAYRLEKEIAAEETRLLDILREQPDRQVRVQNGMTSVIWAKIGSQMPQCRPAWKEFFRALASRFNLNPDAEEQRVTSEVRASLKPEDVVEIHQDVVR